MQSTQGRCCALVRFIFFLKNARFIYLKTTNIRILTLDLNLSEEYLLKVSTLKMWKRKRKRKCKRGESIEKSWNSMKMQIIEFTKKI